MGQHMGQTTYSTTVLGTDIWDTGSTTYSMVRNNLEYSVRGDLQTPINYRPKTNKKCTESYSALLNILEPCYEPKQAP
jgi:hypothetical protein